MAERTFHRVLRGIDGCEAKIGDVIETTSWTTALALEHMGYLKRCEAPATAVVFREEVAEPIVSEVEEPIAADTPPHRPYSPPPYKAKARKGGM